MLSDGDGNLRFFYLNADSAWYSSAFYNATVGGTNRDVFVDNNGKIGYVSSLRASKTEIQNLSDISWIYSLNPVSFKYRKKDGNGYTDEPDGETQYGMIAEEVQQVRPDLCFYDAVDENKELRGVQYSKLIPVLVKAIQELNAKVDAQAAEIATLKGTQP
jgi:lipopolysaccharide export LptBFGC system permease protein LptF